MKPYRAKLINLMAVADIAPKPFLIRVKPHPGESLLSIIARAAEANVFERLTDLLSLAGMKMKVPAYIPFTRLEDAGRLSSALDVPVEDVQFRMHRPISDLSVLNRVDWYGEQLPRRYIDATPRRFSPAALRRSDHHRAAWMLKPLGFCPETMEFLQSSCPHCKKPTEWKFTLSIGRCEHCNKSLRRFKPGKLPWHLRVEAASVAALVSTDPGKRTLAVHSYPEPFCHWKAGDIFVAAVEVGTLVADHGLGKK
jgi:hypothetical protein